MRTITVYSILTVILLYSCENEKHQVTSKYRLSALEFQGDTIGSFIYSNNKLVSVKNPWINKQHTFVYDTNDRVEMIKCGKVEHAFTYYRNEEITIETTQPDYNTYYRQFILNEEGKPVHSQENGGYFGWVSEWRSHKDYYWEGENLISIDHDDDPSFAYTSYPNPFYEILNNHLWYFIYISLEFPDLSYFVLPSKYFVSTITNWSMSEQVTREISVVFDHDRNVVTSATDFRGQVLNFIYDIEEE